MIVVNFKNYKEAVGNNAINLAKVCEEVHNETGVEIVVAVTALDLYKIASEVKIPVWIQHVDGIGYGAYTGWTLPEQVVGLGGKGVILNHSEHKLLADELRKAVHRCKYV